VDCFVLRWYFHLGDGEAVAKIGHPGLVALR
jgi:hypothetical protein